MARKLNWTKLKRHAAGLQSARLDRENVQRYNKLARQYEQSANVSLARWAWRKPSNKATDRARQRDWRESKRLINSMGKCRTLFQLKRWWARHQRALKRLPKRRLAAVIAEKDLLKACLTDP